MNVIPDTPKLHRPNPRLLHHNATRYMRAPGCATCPHLDLCGGINNATNLFDCKIQCCGQPESCDWVCPKAPDFRKRVQAFKGFTLDNVSIPSMPATSPLPSSVPLIYHSYRRQSPLDVTVAAVKLAQLYERRTGRPRFDDPSALREEFKLASHTRIIASGVDDDPIIERWSGIGAKARVDVIAAMKAAEIELVTAPNFSVCLDWPRTGDLASIKRIAIACEEFAKAGMAATLHVNGRTDRDFERWTKFLRRLPAITHISYEFTTGAALSSRRPLHANWLAQLASGVDRPLHLVVYGDSAIAHGLQLAFAGVTWIETNSFIKTIKRFRAVRRGNSAIDWERHPTVNGAALDALLAHNIRETAHYYSLRSHV